MAEPALRRNTKQGGKAYVVRGERYASVTDILDRGLPKKALFGWYAEQGAGCVFDEYETLKDKGRDKAIAWAKNAPNRNRDKAAVRGSAVHDFAEKSILGQPIDIDSLATEEMKALARGFQLFVKEMSPKFVMSEATVVSHKYRYAGTLDGMCELPDLGLTLYDFKGKPSAEKSQFIYSDHVLQTNAYAFADAIILPNGDEEPLPKAKSAGIIYLYPEGYKFHEVKISEAAHRAFRYIAAVADFVSDGYKEFVI